jgi:tetratricopeptide (TPR) repeat protein
VLLGTCYNNPFVLDDKRTIEQNPELISRPFYFLSAEPYLRHLPHSDRSRPLTFLTYSANAYFSSDPASFRATNTALHVANCLAWEALVTSIFGEEARAIAAASALLFLVAPLTWGTAAYVYGRAEILAALFELGACVAIVRTEMLGSTRPSGAVQSGAWHWLTIGSAVAAVSSKQTALRLVVLLPLVLGARSRTARQGFGTAAAWAGVLGACALVYLVARLAVAGSVFDLEAEQVPPLGEYLAHQPAALMQYALLLLLGPVRAGGVKLTLDHAFTAESLSPLWPLALLFMLAAVAHGRVGTFCILWYLSAVGCTALVPTTDALAERRAYLGAPALLLAACALVSSCVRNRAFRRALLAASAAVFLAHSAARNRTFGSEEAVWTEALDAYPHSVRALNNLATLLSREEARAAEARRLYERLVLRNPLDAHALSNLGILCLRSAAAACAEPYASAMLRRAVDADTRRTLAPPRFALALVAERQGRAADAAELYREALEIDPGHTRARRNLKLVEDTAGFSD